MITGYGLGKSLTWFLQPFSEIMSRGIFSQFYILILGLWLSIGVWAETPRYKMSYADYEATVKEAVARVPELHALFEATDRGVYFGGGGLRGLLKWIDKEIRQRETTQSPLNFLADLKSGKVEVPTVMDLIQKGADLDLWVASPAVRQVLHRLGFHHWDLLDDAFYKASVKAGGAALEKLQASPSFIRDPYGALKDWYNGEISFKLAEPNDFQQTTDVLRHNNSQTALALRFLRFAVENPELKISQDSWKALGQLAVREKALPEKNWWIAKGLGKLFRASNGDVPKILELLEKSGLLENLISNGYTIRSADLYNRNYVPNLLNFHNAVRGMHYESWRARERYFGFIGLRLSDDEKPGQALLRSTDNEIRGALTSATTLNKFLFDSGLAASPNDYYLTWDGDLKEKVRLKLEPHFDAMALRPDANEASSFMEHLAGRSLWQEKLQTAPKKAKALLLSQLKGEKDPNELAKAISELLLEDPNTDRYPFAVFRLFPEGKGLEEMIRASPDLDTFFQVFKVRVGLPYSEVRNSIRPHLSALANKPGGYDLDGAMALIFGGEWNKLRLEALGTPDEIRTALSTPGDRQVKLNLAQRLAKTLKKLKVEALLELFEEHPEAFRRFIELNPQLTDFNSMFGLYDSGLELFSQKRDSLRKRLETLLLPHLDLLAKKWDRPGGGDSREIRLIVNDEPWNKARLQAMETLREFFATSTDFLEKARTIDQFQGPHTPRNYLLYDLFLGKERDFARFIESAANLDEIFELWGLNKEQPAFWQSQFGELIKIRIFGPHLAALATKPDAVSDHKIMHHLMGAEKWQRAVEDVRKTGGADCASHLTQIAAGR